MKPIGKACHELSIAAGRNSDCHFYQFIGNRKFAFIRVCLVQVEAYREGSDSGVTKPYPRWRKLISRR